MLSVGSAFYELGKLIVAMEMPWSTFFALRQRLRWGRRLAGVPGVAAFFFGEGAVLSMPVFDPTQTVLGMDPLLAVGIASLVGAGASYLGAQALYSFLWKAFNRSRADAFEQRRADFCRRIVRHRANVPPSPTELNLSLDFYGDRIRSVADYRSWLRKQNQLRSNRIFKL